MSSESFSLAEAEAAFSPEDIEHVKRSVKAAPRFSPEQVMALRALFASARASQPATPAADAA